MMLLDLFIETVMTVLTLNITYDSVVTNCQFLAN